MVHAGLAQVPYRHSDLLSGQFYSSVVASFQDPDKILPILRGLTELDDVVDMASIRGNVSVAVDVFERKRDIAESNLNGLLLEFRAVLGFVYELLLFGCEVFWEQDLGV